MNTISFPPNRPEGWEPYDPYQYDEKALRELDLWVTYGMVRAAQNGQLQYDAEEDWPSEVRANPDKPCPPEILASQTIVEVVHLGFDRYWRLGCIEVHEAAAQDVTDFFNLAIASDFPIEKVLPSSYPDYMWDDDKLMAGNVTSGFNYRLIAGTNEPSLHGKGLAFDVNPRQNPYIRYENGEPVVKPVGAIWDPSAPGTLHADHILVKFMESHGWEWGGHWTLDTGRTDYQHFQKTLT